MSVCCRHFSDDTALQWEQLNAARDLTRPESKSVSDCSASAPQKGHRHSGCSTTWTRSTASNPGVRCAFVYLYNWSMLTCWLCNVCPNGSFLCVRVRVCVRNHAHSAACLHIRGYSVSHSVCLCTLFQLNASMIIRQSFTKRPWELGQREGGRGRWSGAGRKRKKEEEEKTGRKIKR